MNKVKPNSQEILERLRKGEMVVCPCCKKGRIRPTGNPETTCHFKCDTCKKALNIN